MNMTQTRVSMQYFITALAAYIVGKGWLAEDEALQVATLIVGIVPFVYGVWKSRNKGKLEAAAKVPGVVIVAPDEIANSSTKANIIPASENEVTKK